MKLKIDIYINTAMIYMFAQQTSYHYAFNSPLIWKDPCGLKGEKERGDKMMTYTDLLQVCNIALNTLDFLLNRQADNEKYLDNPLSPFPDHLKDKGGSSGGSAGQSKFQSPTSANLSGSDLPTSGIPKSENPAGNFGKSGGGYSSLGSGNVNHDGIKSISGVVANWNSLSENYRYAYKNNSSSTYDYAANYNINEFNNDIDLVFNYINSSPCGYIVKYFNSVGGKIEYSPQDPRFGLQTKTIYWNPRQGQKTKSGNYLSPAVVLFHELIHWCNALFPNLLVQMVLTLRDEQYDYIDERIIIINFESPFAKFKGEINSNVSRSDDNLFESFPTSSPTSNIPLKTFNHGINYQGYLRRKR